MSNKVVTKKCTKCKKPLALTEFYRRSNTACGRKGTCKKCQTKEQITYRQTKSGKRNRYLENQKHRHFHREQKIAYDAIYHAIKVGAIQPPHKFICVKCQKRKATHYHHSDYSQKLNVIPVCRFCHKTIHNSSNEG